MRISNFFYISVLMLINHTVSGQNTLWLTNGKKIEIGEFKIQNADFISFKSLKNKSKSIERFEVFSIIENGGNEIVIYKQDTSYQEAFNLLEMRAFVQGETDAIKNFKSPLTTYAGIAVTGASSIFIPPVLVILVPTAYCTGIGLSKPWDKKLNIPLEYKNNDNYILGYQKECKHKRILNAIIGSGIGLVAGFTTLIILK